jgi:hypothetical protein
MANVFAGLQAWGLNGNLIKSSPAQPTEWQRIGDQIKAAMIFARTDFINVDR